MTEEGKFAILIAATILSARKLAELEEPDKLTPKLAPGKLAIPGHGKQNPRKCFGMFGAQERTRTSTTVRPLAPEASASASSATWAREMRQI